jgi:hypothetical protein
MISRRAFVAALPFLAATRALAAGPALPAWMPSPTIKGAGLNRVSIAVPERFRPPTGDTIWLAPDGKDAGDGTSDKPFASLQHAFERPEPVIVCKPGRYAPAVLTAAKKSILASGRGVVIATPAYDIAQNDFRPGTRPGLYTTVLPRSVVPYRILLRESLDRFGFEQRLPNSPDGWQYDATTSEFSVSLKVADLNELRRSIRILCVNSVNRESLLTNNGGTIAIGPGVKLEGVGIVSRSYRGEEPTTILNGCQIIFGYSNALTAKGGCVFAMNVRLHASQIDSFNYDPDEGGRIVAVEYNCHASEAGDAQTYGATTADGKQRYQYNGSSSHGGTVVRYGGLYENSQGPDIADTAWPGTTSVSANYGVMVRNSRVGYGFAFTGRGTEPGECLVYLDRCSAEGETIDLLSLSSAGSRVFISNSRLRKQWKLSAGTIDTYTP